MTTETAIEINFDGLVGPTHNYAGLSAGNLASIRHGGDVSNPRAAALQGLEKMWRLVSWGLPGAVLPPQPRPDVATLRRLGFCGSDAAVLARAAREEPRLLAQCSSASSMWTANAATVVPALDTEDGRTHLVVANLVSMLHRQLEVPTTTAVLRAIFADETRFAVHDALPPLAQYGDEGAANHTRLCSSRGSLHLFAWGRDPNGSQVGPVVHPARQSLSASRAVARLAKLGAERALFEQQHPDGIDAGAFHTDVLAVGNQNVLLVHELAFRDLPGLVQRATQRLGEELRVVVCSNAELPVADAVAAYPFNSQLVSLPSGKMRLVAPLESQATASVRRFIERVVSEDNPVEAVEYLDVRQSMANGGGPACLRLRVALPREHVPHLCGRVLLDAALHSELEAWITRHYRDRLAPSELADPLLLTECHQALDELTSLLELGSVYDFQRS